MAIYVSWAHKTLHWRSVIVKYWKLKLSETRIISDVKEALNKLEIDLADEDIYQGNKDRPIRSQLRLAFKKRREARNNSFELRQSFLKKLAKEEAALNENSTKEKILRSMKRTEAQKRMYKILNQYLKPNQRAGIAQIKVPTTNNEGHTELKTVTVKEEMEEELDEWDDDDEERKVALEEIKDVIRAAMLEK